MIASAQMKPQTRNPTGESFLYRTFDALFSLAGKIQRGVSKVFEFIFSQANRLFRPTSQNRQVVHIEKTIPRLKSIRIQLDQIRQNLEIAREPQDEQNPINQQIQEIERPESPLEADLPADPNPEMQPTPAEASPLPAAIEIDYKRASEEILENPHLYFKEVHRFITASQENKTAIGLKIEEILRLQVQNLSTEVFSQRISLMEKQKQKQNELIEQLKTLKVECLKDDGQNALIVEMRKVGDELNEASRRAIKIELIRKYDPQFSAEQLSSEQINIKYQDCQKKESKIEGLQRGLDQLVKHAKLDNDLAPSYGITLGFSQDKFQIRAASINNPSMGYTIFWFLIGAKIMPADKHWDGEQTFSLTEEELDKLRSYLDLLNRWYNDFTNIISDLLVGDTTNQLEKYISIAQKTARETLSSLTRATDKGRDSLLQLRSEQPCLLLGQMSLNLDGHPECSFIKSQLEAMYKAEGMKSFDGKFKQFFIGTNRTNLDVDQMKKICPHLNRYLRFQKHLMTFSDEHSLFKGLESLTKNKASFGYAKDEDILRDYLVTCSIETLKKIVPLHQLGTVQIEIEEALRPIEASIQNPEPLYKAYEAAMGALIKKWMVIRFSPLSNTYSPSEAQITELYGSDEKKAYGPTTDVFRDLDKLFSKLIKAPAVDKLIKASPAILNHINIVKKALEKRLTTRYHKLRETGWPSSKARTQEAIKLLEVFVATIVDQKGGLTTDNSIAIAANQKGSRITDNSIETAISQLSSLAIDIDHLNQGCDEGLEGRLQSLALALSTDHIPSLPAYAVQFLKDSIEKAKIDFTERETYRQHNTSHNNVYASELQRYFGIQTVSTGAPITQYSVLSSNAKEMLRFVLNHYTPEKLYDLAKSFIENEMWLLTIEANTAENNHRIYAYLQELEIEGTSDEIDKKYRLRGKKENPFQYALIEGDIQKQIPFYLIKTKLLQIAPNPNNSRIRCQRDGDELQTL